MKNTCCKRGVIIICREEMKKMSKFAQWHDYSDNIIIHVQLLCFVRFDQNETNGTLLYIEYLI